MLGAGSELDEYKSLLKEGLWRPTSLELFVMDRDGKNLRQVTKLGGANFAPSWHPDGKRLIFASNHEDPKGRNFDLYLVNLDGTGIERISFNETFDGFPMFSPDGKKLVFASNRNAKSEGETNVFIADWVN
jgi:Tol biopolymer transport system component